MSIITRILKFVWAFWGMLIIISTLTVFFLLQIINFSVFPKKAHYFAHYANRVWAWVLLTLMGVQVKRKGLEKLDPSKSYVFISNHSSQLDIPVCARATKHNFKFLSKEELGKVPLLGWIIRKMYITVSRQSAADRKRSLEKMQNSLEKGISVFLYPEGTRNRSDEPLGRFFDGAFKLAIESGHELAVLRIKNTKKLLPPGELFQLSPGTVEVEWAEPISTKGMSLDDVPKLKKYSREFLLEGL